MHWKEYTSKKYGVPYWHNSKTNESTWKKPQERIDYEKQKEERRRIAKERDAEYMRIYNEQKAERDAFWEKKKQEDRDEKRNKKQNSSYQNDHNTSSYSMQAVSGNGMSWTIEGQSHWTREDYLDELRNLNEAMRDFWLFFVFVFVFVLRFCVQ